MLTCLNPCDPQTVAGLLTPLIEPDARVVDIGCGRGAALSWFSEHTGYALFGVEPDRGLNDLARENCTKAVIARAGAEDLPFGDWAFDAALMECVFSILDDPPAAVGELKRIVCRHGYVVLTDLYTRGGEDQYAGQSALLRHIYTRRTMEAFFMRSGFALVRFLDRTVDMGSMIAQMFMDGVARDFVDDKTVKLLRQSRAGYGIWIWINT